MRTTRPDGGVVSTWPSARDVARRARSRQRDADDTARSPCCSAVVAEQGPGELLNCASTPASMNAEIRLDTAAAAARHAASATTSTLVPVELRGTRRAVRLVVVRMQPDGHLRVSPSRSSATRAMRDEQLAIERDLAVHDAARDRQRQLHHLPLGLVNHLRAQRASAPRASPSGGAASPRRARRRPRRRRARPARSPSRTPRARAAAQRARSRHRGRSRRAAARGTVAAAGGAGAPGDAPQWNGIAGRSPRRAGGP